jgi:hypothetical protein
MQTCARVGVTESESKDVDRGKNLLTGGASYKPPALPGDTYSEAKLLGVELNRPLDIPRAEDRVGFFEHGKVRNTRDCARCSSIDLRYLT